MEGKEEQIAGAAALVYSPRITPRLVYVVDFLSHYYGFPFILTADEEAYKSSTVACKICYSKQPLAEGEIGMAPHTLLFETAIHSIEIACFQHRRYTAFFKSEGSTGFDLLAAIFFLISRYEEYGLHPKDAYGRFAHTASAAFKNNFLHLPLVNIWLEDFRTALAQKNALFATRHHRFSFLPTYDIDMAWSYKNKGLLRQAGALAILLSKGAWRAVAHRIKVLRNKAADPFEAYAWMDDLHRHRRLSPIYFLLVAAKRGPYDKNIRTNNKAFGKLVKGLAQTYSIGLHPSWQSGDKRELVNQEKKTLEYLAAKPVIASRQHYIRFALPETFRTLIEAGIMQDYSMGYGSSNGFRASVAIPYYWYDLEKEAATSLLLYPFCFMDANAFYEQKLSATEAAQELQQYYTVVKEVQGTLIVIWHNSFLGTGAAFAGWRKAYETFLAEVAKA